MRHRLVAEGTFAAVLMAAGVTLFVLAPDLVRGWAFAIPGTTDVALEPAFFPRLASAALAVSAFIVLATLPLRRETPPVEALTGRNLANVAIGLTGILVYLALIGILGFVVASSLFIVLATWFGGYRRLTVLVLVAIGVSLALRLVFRFGLHVGLPTGLFY